MVLETLSFCPAFQMILLLLRLSIKLIWYSFTVYYFASVLSYERMYMYMAEADARDRSCSYLGGVAVCGVAV